MPIDQSRLEKWAKKDTRRELVQQVLRTAGITIDYIHEDRDSLKWGLFVELPKAFAELFGTRRELLVWGSFYSATQARDLDDALGVLNAEKVRLSQDILLFVCAGHGSAEVILEASHHLEVSVAVVTESTIRNCKPHGSRQFIDVLRARLYGRDLYDLKSPVTRSVNFFGREHLLNTLRIELRTGTSHIGIFGLRKIGKTSLVNRLSMSLSNQGSMRVAHVDLQRVSSINPSGSYLLWHLGEALYDADRQLRRRSDLRLFGKYEVFSDIANERQVWEFFDHDLRLAMEYGSNQIILIMDEIERIYPSSISSPWSRDFVRVWPELGQFSA